MTPVIARLSARLGAMMRHRRGGENGHKRSADGTEVLSPRDELAKPPTYIRDFMASASRSLADDGVVQAIQLAPPEALGHRDMYVASGIGNPDRHRRSLPPAGGRSGAVPS